MIGRSYFKLIFWLIGLIAIVAFPYFLGFSLGKVATYGAVFVISIFIGKNSKKTEI